MASVHLGLAIVLLNHTSSRDDGPNSIFAEYIHLVVNVRDKFEVSSFNHVEFHQNQFRGFGSLRV